MKPSRVLVGSFVLGALLLLPAGAARAAGAPPPAPPVSMASGLLVELNTGRVLWSENPDQPRAPASLTKVLTALTVLENVSLDGFTTISNAARTVDGARMYAEEGWRFTMGDLLWGMLLQSGNDAAIALAENASPDGTVPGFMSMANALAVRLGATNSNFVNPHGLDAPGHMTTAHDLGLITLAAMHDDRFVQMVSSKTHVVPWGDGSKHMFINHNKLLWRYQGAVGVKTGFTDLAGPSLISAVEREGTTLIAVVLGSGNHYGDSTALYDWAFGNLDALRAASTQTLAPDLNGNSVELNLQSAGDLELARAAAGASRNSLNLLLTALAAALLVTVALIHRLTIYSH